MWCVSSLILLGDYVDLDYISGGTGWTGATTCASGTCTYSSAYYSEYLTLGDFHASLLISFFVRQVNASLERLLLPISLGLYRHSNKLPLCYLGTFK